MRGGCLDIVYQAVVSIKLIWGDRSSLVTRHRMNVIDWQEKPHACSLRSTLILTFNTALKELKLAPAIQATMELG